MISDLLAYALPAFPSIHLPQALTLCTKHLYKHARMRLANCTHIFLKNPGSAFMLLNSLLIVKCEVRARIPIMTGYKMFLHVYRNNVDNKEYLTIVFDAERPSETEFDRMIRGVYIGWLYLGRTSSRPLDFLPVPPLVRIYLECYTSETLNKAACLMSFLNVLSSRRGIRLGEKLKANDIYEANILLQHPANARSYRLATVILIDLGLGGKRGIWLLINNLDKVCAVKGPNREVIVKERVAIIPLASEEVEKYLLTKVREFINLAP
ncbi:hypothetical protein V2W45_1465210 [Cenococcum geophilum]